MNKRLIQIVSLLLISCLTADSPQAGMLMESLHFPSVGTVSQTDSLSPFQEEAFALRRPFYRVISGGFISFWTQIARSVRGRKTRSEADTVIATPDAKTRTGREFDKPIGQGPMSRDEIIGHQDTFAAHFIDSLTKEDVRLLVQLGMGRPDVNPERRIAIGIKMEAYILGLLGARNGILPEGNLRKLWTVGPDLHRAIYRQAAMRFPPREALVESGALTDRAQAQAWTGRLIRGLSDPKEDSSEAQEIMVEALVDLAEHWDKPDVLQNLSPGPPVVIEKVWTRCDPAPEPWAVDFFERWMTRSGASAAGVIEYLIEQSEKAQKLETLPMLLSEMNAEVAVPILLSELHHHYDLYELARMSLDEPQLAHAGPQRQAHLAQMRDRSWHLNNWAEYLLKQVAQNNPGQVESMSKQLRDAEIKEKAELERIQILQAPAVRSLLSHRSHVDGDPWDENTEPVDRLLKALIHWPPDVSPIYQKPLVDALAGIAVNEGLTKGSPESIFDRIWGLWLETAPDWAPKFFYVLTYTFQDEPGVARALIVNRLERADPFRPLPPKLQALLLDIGLMKSEWVLEPALEARTRTEDPQAILELEHLILSLAQSGDSRAVAKFLAHRIDPGKPGDIKRPHQRTRHHLKIRLREKHPTVNLDLIPWLKGMLHQIGALAQDDEGSELAEAAIVKAAAVILAKLGMAAGSLIGLWWLGHSPVLLTTILLAASGLVGLTVTTNGRNDPLPKIPIAFVKLLYSPEKHFADDAAKAIAGRWPISFDEALNDSTRLPFLRGLFSLYPEEHEIFHTKEVQRLLTYFQSRPPFYIQCYVDLGNGQAPSTLGAAPVPSSADPSTIVGSDWIGPFYTAEDAAFEIVRRRQSGNLGKRFGIRVGIGMPYKYFSRMKSFLTTGLYASDPEHLDIAANDLMAVRFKRRWKPVLPNGQIRPYQYTEERGYTIFDLPEMSVYYDQLEESERRDDKRVREGHASVDYLARERNLMEAERNTRSLLFERLRAVDRLIPAYLAFDFRSGKEQYKELAPLMENMNIQVFEGLADAIEFFEGDIAKAFLKSDIPLVGEKLMEMNKLLIHPPFSDKTWDGVRGKLHSTSFDPKLTQSIQDQLGQFWGAIADYISRELHLPRALEPADVLKRIWPIVGMVVFATLTLLELSHSLKATTMLTLGGLAAGWVYYKGVQISWRDPQPLQEDFQKVANKLFDDIQAITSKSSEEQVEKILKRIDAARYALKTLAKWPGMFDDDVKRLERLSVGFEPLIRKFVKPEDKGEFVVRDAHIRHLRELIRQLVAKESEIEAPLPSRKTPAVRKNSLHASA